jgi:hypothetical protein
MFSALSNKIDLFEMMAVQTTALSINLQSNIFFSYSPNARNLQAMWPKSFCSLNQKKKTVEQYVLGCLFSAL